MIFSLMLYVIINVSYANKIAYYVTCLGSLDNDLW